MCKYMEVINTDIVDPIGWVIMVIAFIAYAYGVLRIRWDLIN